jgi:hypothetical protein
MRISSKVVADWTKAWGLYDGDWAFVTADDGAPVSLLWPAAEYACAFAQNQWSAYVPRGVDLDELVDVLLPRLEKDGVLLGIFPTIAEMGATVSVDELRKVLEHELENYD